MFSHPVPNVAAAAGLTLLSSAFIAGTSLLAKSLATGALGPPLPALQMSHGRFLFAFLVIGGVFLCVGSDWKSRPLECILAALFSAGQAFLCCLNRPRSFRCLTQRLSAFLTQCKR